MRQFARAILGVVLLLSAMSKELNERQNTLLGMAAAFIEGIIVQPTLYLKTARAQGLKFTLDPRILYRGTGASLVNEMQCMALQFGMTAYIQKMTSAHGGGRSTFLNSDLSGAIAGGMITAVFASPIELVMIQQQLHGGTIVSTPARIIKKYGIGTRGIMRSLGVTVCRDAIYVGSMLGVTPLLQHYFEEKHQQSPVMASLNASLIGGLIAAVPSHPFDIVKTCMQADLDQNTYTTATKTIARMYQQGGVTRFFNGCLWRSLNIVTTVWVANECKNRFTGVFSKF